MRVVRAHSRPPVPTLRYHWSRSILILSFNFWICKLPENKKKLRLGAGGIPSMLMTWLFLSPLIERGHEIIILGLLCGIILFGCWGFTLLWNIWNYHTLQSVSFFLVGGGGWTSCWDWNVRSSYQFAFSLSFLDARIRICLHTALDIPSI